MAINQNNAGNSAAQPQDLNGNQESIELARRLPNDTPGRITIEGSAPWRQGRAEVGGVRVFAPELGAAGQQFPGGGLTHDVRNTAVIRIDVQVLRNEELGLLNATGNQLQANLATAMREKQAEDLRKYNMTPEQMVEKSRELGYYGSGAHQAWAEAASARTGGRVSAEYWMRFDPLGGTNGNGPNIELGGIYPHPLSKIAMAHDTDWSLGRYFNAGPLNGLYQNTGNDRDLGMYGLQHLQLGGGPSPINPQPRAQYAGPGGNAIWDIDYNNQPTRTRRAGVDSDDGSVVASANAPERNANPGGNASTTLVSGNDHLNRQFAQALQGTHGDRDAAAAAIETLRNTAGYKADQDIAVVQGRNGQWIATQGQGDAALNALVTKVNPGDFERVANQIAQAPQPTQTAAVQPDQPERPRTV
jgi:hypothetical protein